MARLRDLRDHDDAALATMTALGLRAVLLCSAAVDRHVAITDQLDSLDDIDEHEQGMKLFTKLLSDQINRASAAIMYARAKLKERTADPIAPMPAATVLAALEEN